MDNNRILEIFEEIERHRGVDGCIYDLENLLDDLKKENPAIENLIGAARYVLYHNSEIYDSLKKANQELKYAAKILNDYKKEDKTSILKNDETDSHDSSVDDYLEYVLTISDREIISDINKQSNKEQAYNYVLLLLKKYINECHDILLISSPSDKIDIEKEIELVQNKYDTIKKQRDSSFVTTDDKEEIKQTNSENKVIFLFNGNVCLPYEDIMNDKDENALSSYVTLIKSVYSGNFKYLKRFIEYGVSQQRHAKVRLLHDVIGDNVHVIIGAFTKGESINGYRGMLRNKINNYLALKPRLIEQLNDENEREKLFSDSEKIKNKIYNELVNRKKPGENKVKSLTIKG